MKAIMDTVRSAWHEIHDNLQTCKVLINDEIGRYPAPIAGCDQQFNYLLEKRRLILDELKQLSITEPASLKTNDPAAAIVDFLQASQCIAMETKMHIKALVRENNQNIDTIDSGVLDDK